MKRAQIVSAQSVSARRADAVKSLNAADAADSTELNV